jgi:uncharacterized surface protein with fasciclin (FAS1) repeats
MLDNTLTIVVEVVRYLRFSRSDLATLLTRETSHAQEAVFRGSGRRSDDRRGPRRRSGLRHRRHRPGGRRLRDAARGCDRGQALLADKEALTQVLLYHVVPGKVAAADVVTLSSAETAAGQEVSIEVVDGSVKVDDATVVATDIEASNGIIHVIDRVILPEM